MADKIGTKEHYFHTVFHMLKLMDKILDRSPESVDDLKDLFTGLQIINNEYVLKRSQFIGHKKGETHVEAGTTEE